MGVHAKPPRRSSDERESAIHHDGSVASDTSRRTNGHPAPLGEGRSPWPAPHCATRPPTISSRRRTHRCCSSTATGIRRT